MTLQPIQPRSNWLAEKNKDQLDLMIPTNRLLNSNGKEAYYRAHVTITTIFSIVMIFYAAFRGQKVVTQVCFDHYVKRLKTLSSRQKHLFLTIFNLDIKSRRWIRTLIGWSSSRRCFGQRQHLGNCLWISWTKCFRIHDFPIHRLNFLSSPSALQTRMPPWRFPTAK